MAVVTGLGAYRYWYQLSGRQIAEAAVIGQRSMPQQLVHQSQGLICQVLVDKWLLPRECFGGTARGQIVILLVGLEDFRVLCCAAIYVVQGAMPQQTSTATHDLHHINMLERAEKTHY